MQTAYQPGTLYSPAFKKVFWTGVWAGVPARVSLQFFRDIDGLVVYQFCVEVDAQTVSQAALFLVLRAAIVALIFSRSPVLIGVIIRLSSLLTGSPLLGSVGVGGANDIADTRYVQRLLNDWRGHRGFPLLNVDGDVGSLTTEAIVTFQQTETGDSDGRVDVGGAAIGALERIHLDSLPETVDAEVLGPDNRAGLGEAAFVAVLTAPSHADELGAATGPLDPFDVLSESVAEYLRGIRNQVFDLS